MSPLWAAEVRLAEAEPMNMLHDFRQCTRPTRARHIHTTCTRCARACERNFLTIDLTQNNSII